LKRIVIAIVWCKVLDADDWMDLGVGRKLQFVGQRSDLANDLVGSFTLGCGFALCCPWRLVLLAE
jgi:hypothetical protein